MHFPTDLNLLWDAQRKCVDLLRPLSERYRIGGWRKARDWQRKLKGQMRLVTKVCQGGGPDKEKRLKAATRKYLAAGYGLEEKVFESLRALRQSPLSWQDLLGLEEVDYFHTMLIKHLDLVERRLIGGEIIAHSEKVFSVFEPHTQWIAKGKLFPPVELGHKLLVTTDQNELILDYRVMEQLADVDEVVPLADRLLSRYGEGNLQSLSFDKGFTRQQDRELLELYIPEVILPKRGKRSQADEQREQQRSFKRLRHRHQAIESDINCLEHHGLNRCLDKGLHGYKRYVGFGVLAYNLHKIGARLLKGQRVRQAPGPELKAAA